MLQRYLLVVLMFLSLSMTVFGYCQDGPRRYLILQTTPDKKNEYAVGVLVVNDDYKDVQLQLLAEGGWLSIIMRYGRDRRINYLIASSDFCYRTIINDGREIPTSHLVNALREDLGKAFEYVGNPRGWIESEYRVNSYSVAYLRKHLSRGTGQSDDVNFFNDVEISCTCKKSVDKQHSPPQCCDLRRAPFYFRQDDSGGVSQFKHTAANFYLTEYYLAQVLEMAVIRLILPDLTSNELIGFVRARGSTLTGPNLPASSHSHAFIYMPNETCKGNNTGGEGWGPPYDEDDDNDENNPLGPWAEPGGVSGASSY